jgi:hypothetical protein
LTGCPQRENFSMGGWVFVTFSAIFGGCDEVIIGVNDNGTNWHFSCITR